MSDLIKMGYQRVIEFENGYGLSIVSHPEFTYGGKDGLFEIALLDMDKDGEIIYDPALGFSDVIGHLDFAEVAEIIERIKGELK
jgi:hypothetical protein